jgi:hypothetical protein
MKEKSVFVFLSSKRPCIHSGIFILWCWRKKRNKKNKNLKHQKKFDADYFLKQEMNFLLLNIIIIIVNCNNYIT